MHATCSLEKQETHWVVSRPVLLESIRDLIKSILTDTLPPPLSLVEMVEELMLWLKNSIVVKPLLSIFLKVLMVSEELTSELNSHIIHIDKT